jgi:hypothetical protein
MLILKSLDVLATGRLTQHVLPNRVRNRLYRMFIGKLTKEAKASTNSQEIFLTPSICCDRSSKLKVVSLVSTKDLEMLLWSLKSLFFFSNSSWDLWVLDGGLNCSDVQVIERHFPGARVFVERELAPKLRIVLSPYPNIKRFRMSRRYAPARKIVDAPWLLRGQKFLLLDSDVLFFKNPVEIVKRLLDPKMDHFTFSMETGGINTGVAIIPESGVCFPQLEALLQLMPAIQREGWWAEHHLYAGISKNCFDGFSNMYAVAPVQAHTYDALVCCHYIHTCRHRFYQEGVMQLRSLGFPKNLP